MVVFSHLKDIMTVSLVLSGTAKAMQEDETRTPPSVEILQEKPSPMSYAKPIFGLAALTGGVVFATERMREDRNDNEFVGDAISAELANLPDVNVEVNPSEGIQSFGGLDDTLLPNEHILYYGAGNTNAHEVAENLANKISETLGDDVVVETQAIDGDAGVTWFHNLEPDTIAIEFMVVFSSIIFISVAWLSYLLFNNSPKLVAVGEVVTSALAIATTTTLSLAFGFHFSAMGGDHLAGAYACFGGAVFCGLVTPLLLYALAQGPQIKNAIHHAVGGLCLIGAFAMATNGVSESFADIAVGSNGGMGADAILTQFPLTIALFWIFIKFVKTDRVALIGGDYLIPLAAAAVTGFCLTTGIDMVAQQNAPLSITFFVAGTIVFGYIVWMMRKSDSCFAKRNL